MHGHSYRLEVAVHGPLQTQGPARGMVQDFDRIERIVAERVLGALDHRHLNELVENPTVENIVLWTWERLENDLPRLDELVLWETATSCAVLRRTDIARS
jgi:6-pyruvoyltetrahydropterin/6-carboxytetrahydropterin synthase